MVTESGALDLSSREWTNSKSRFEKVAAIYSIWLLSINVTDDCQQQGVKCLPFTTTSKTAITQRPGLNTAVFSRLGGAAA